MTLDDKVPETQSKRVIIDLTPSANEEIDRLATQRGISTSDLFREALSFYRLIVDEFEIGGRIYSERPNGKKAELKRPY
jgi:hypothetical protein